MKVAVVGATGLAGQEFLVSLANHPQLEVVKVGASVRSAGKKLPFAGGELTVEEMTPESFDGVDIALFSAGASVSKEFAPIAAAKGTLVIDNSSAWRMEPGVPLVVPEVNPGDIAKYAKKNIIANPNCSTAQMVVALKPLHELARPVRKWYPDHKGFFELSVGLTRSKNFLHKNYFCSKHHARGARCGGEGFRMQNKEFTRKQE